MGATSVSRWVVLLVRSIPPLQRVLDAWSQRRAQARRARRLRLAALRQR